MLAFAHLNLRYNPFGELSPDERARLAVVPALELAAREVVQVIGDAGRGKSTHLLAWHSRIDGALYEYVPEGHDCLATGALPETFFVDEAQRLRSEQLDRLFHYVPRLVLGTHDDLSRRTRRHVTTLVLRGMDSERLDKILRRRIEAARRTTGPIPRIRRETLVELVLTYGDDVRAIEGHLYDVFQRLEGPSDVEV